MTHCPSSPLGRLAILALAFIGAMLTTGCSQSEQDNQPAVTLYSSVDDFLLREVVDDFEAQSGIRVELVGDTEATKTTGLMQRLLAERDAPRADVWWSSEPFATERLAREGILAPMPGSITSSLPETWPEDLIAEHWIGFALRSRVFVVRTGALDDPPTTLAELTDERYRGQVAIARPEFGTTRGHVAALVEAWGAEGFEAWLRAMVDNDLRVYSSNSAVVRAVAQGEVLIALTDTDDIWAGQRNGWPIEAVYEAMPPEAGSPEAQAPFPSTGPLLLPNTVGLVQGSPNPEHARTLIEFLLSPRTAERIAQSDSHNLPIRPELRSKYQQWGPPEGVPVRVGPVADAVPEALAIVERVLGSP